jgi:hypothetical protein
VVPARCALPLARHDRDGGLVAERRPADPAERPRRQRHDAPVDRRLVRPRLRRAPARGRRARRPVRAQGDAAVRPALVRDRCDRQWVRRVRRDRDCRSCRPGRRRGVRDAGDPFAADGDLPAAGTGQGDRHLGRVRRRRRRARPHRFRRSTGELLVGVGVPLQRSRRRPDRRRHCRLQPAVAGRQRDAARPAGRIAVPRRPHVAALRHYRGRRAGLERPLRGRLVPRRRRHAVRLHPLGDRRRAPDAAGLLLRRPPLQRRQ